MARKSRNKPWVDQAKSNDQNNVNNLIDFSGIKEQKNLDNFNQKSSSVSPDSIGENIAGVNRAGRIAENASKIPTAIYARLSEEDNGYQDGDSIDMQVAYIHKYLMESPEFELYDTYIDNGYSGTNFERPDFKRLLQDAYNGKVQCILIKDLSRFGRNYLEVGLFIENIFPKLKIRLISINDNFDSSKEDDLNSLSVPIKNMINEMYARDISSKIKASNKLRTLNPHSAHRSNAPYGYICDKETNTFIPDERFAPYVRAIFQWYLIGVPINEITDRLNSLRAPIPAIVSGKRNKDRFGDKWLPSKVYNILKNPLYTGDTIFNRYTVTGFSGATKETDPSNWVIHKNTHIPLVPREDYWKTKEIMKMNDRSKNDNKNDSKNDVLFDGLNDGKNDVIKAGTNTGSKVDNDLITDDFKGLVYCAKCNRRMSFKKVNYDSQSDRFTHKYYKCTPTESNKNYCGNKISGDLLQMLVMEQISIHTKLLCDKNAVLNKLKLNEDGKDAVFSIDKKIQTLETLISEQKAKSTKLYEDFATGVISEDDYNLLKAKLTGVDPGVEAELSQLYKIREEQVSQINGFLKHIEDVSKSKTAASGNDSGVSSFDPELVHRMIKRINVSEDNNIEVVFKYEGEIESISQILESGL